MVNSCLVRSSSDAWACGTRIDAVCDASGAGASSESSEPAVESIVALGSGLVFFQQAYGLDSGAVGLVQPCVKKPAARRQAPSAQKPYPYQTVL